MKAGSDWCLFLPLGEESSELGSTDDSLDGNDAGGEHEGDLGEWRLGGDNAGVMKCKSTGSSVATFLGTDNLRHPYNSIVYCGSSFPYSIQTVNDISTRSYISIYTGGYPRIKAMQYKRQV